VTRARLHLARGETDRALADCDEAIRLNPTVPWAFYFRGIARTRKGQWDRAIANFDEETKRQPTLEASWLTARGNTLALAGRYDQAEAAYEEAGTFNPGFLPVILSCRAWFIDRPRGNHDQALRMLDQAVNPVWPISPYLYRGLIYVRTGEPDRALADFIQLREIVETRRRDFFGLEDLVPRWLAFLIGRGEAFLLKGDLARALADGDEAVRFAPQSAEARLLRAEVFARQGKRDLAAADRREAEHLAPDPILAPPQPRRSRLDQGH
jgi:tetratricopeptide (TPR) repeat protein